MRQSFGATSVISSIPTQAVPERRESRVANMTYTETPVFHVGRTTFQLVKGVMPLRMGDTCWKSTGLWTYSFAGFCADQLSPLFTKRPFCLLEVKPRSWKLERLIEMTFCDN